MVYIIEIDKKNGIPIYIQVKKQIMHQIMAGTLKAGDKMHTERDLSELLGVSRNTISTAYSELESQGVLRSFQGKGTFVAEEANTWKAQGIKEKIIKFVDLALGEALGNGMSSEEFLQIVTQRVIEKQEIIRKMVGVFIECNSEQAKMFSKQLSVSTNINVKSLSINDLQIMNCETKGIMGEAQVVITTFNHVNEVMELTKEYNKEILGVAINADIGTIVKIARYPEKTKFALFCISDEFKFKMVGALEAAGLGNLDIIFSNARKKEDVIRIVDQVDKIIVSPGRYKDIKNLNQDNKEIIEFLYTLEEGSVKAIKSKILEKKYQK